jgi:hypothetical protein
MDNVQNCDSYKCQRSFSSTSLLSWETHLYCCSKFTAIVILFVVPTRLPYVYYHMPHSRGESFFLFWRLHFRSHHGEGQSSTVFIVPSLSGRDIARAVSRWLPNAKVRAQVTSYGICGGQTNTGVDFLQILPCPLPTIPVITPHLSTFIIRGWHNRPNSGRRTKRIPSHPISSN